jgi:hypothetical protein
MQALGLAESIDPTRIGATVEPDPHAAATYARLLPTVSALDDALARVR